MNFFNRFQGIFLSPQMTLKKISERPVWVDALIILIIVLAFFSYIVAPYAQKDRAQIMKENVKLKERMGEERFNQTIKALENPSNTSRVLQSFILSPITYLIGFLFSSVVILATGRLFSAQGKYLQIFSVYIHVNFIDKIFGNALRLILVLGKKSLMQTSTSLAIFFPRLETTSSAFIILSQADFFQLWLFGIFAYGLAQVFKIELKKAFFISYGFWLLKSLLYIALGLISKQFLG